MNRACYISPTQAMMIESMLPNYLALLCRILRATGLRVTDALHLRTIDVATCAEITIRARKTGKVQTIWLGDTWPDAWDRAWEVGARHQPWLFPGNSLDGTLSRYTVNHWVAAAAYRAGFRGAVSPHSWRKCFAVEFARENGLAALQEYLQHENFSTTLLYAYSDRLCPVQVAPLHPYSKAATQDS